MEVTPLEALTDEVVVPLGNHLTVISILLFPMFSFWELYLPEKDTINCFYILFNKLIFTG